MIESSKCDEGNLIYDEACVVVNNASRFTEAWLYALSSDCDLCPFQRIGQITNALNQNFKIQTATSLTWRIKSNGDNEYSSASNTSDLLCEFRPNLRQYGIYELNINNGSCGVEVLKDPSSLYTPLLVVFAVVLCALGICSLLRVVVNGSRRKLKPDKNGTGVEIQGPNSPASKRRVKCIDTFRGISILLMLFVNDGGGGYWIFGHATWDGILVSDLVFPWFMWIMGVCLPISVGSQLSRQVSRFSICKGIVKRSVILFLLGISRNTRGTNAQLENIRLFGILQRFSIVYLVVALILASLGRRKRIEPKNPFVETFSDILVLLPQWVLVLCILAVHSAITFRLPIPGCPTGYVGPGGRHEDGRYSNCVGGAAGYIDRLVLGVKRMPQWSPARTVYGSGPFDREPILGCLSSIFHGFLGVQAGMILRYYKSWRSRVNRWLVWSVVCGCIGLSLHFTNVVPMNKNLWSISFVLVTTSLALILLTICYILIDVTEFWRGGPFRIPGMNPLAMFVGHQFCYGIFPFHWRYGAMNTHTWRVVEATWGVAIWTIIAYILHRKKIYLVL